MPAASQDTAKTPPRSSVRPGRSPTYRPRTLVTSALPYANGHVHIGHLAGAYLPADIYARYLRAKGSDVAFICGSDEHGVPITITAEKEGTTPQAIIDRYHSANAEAFAAARVDFDIYDRTSGPRHQLRSRSARGVTSGPGNRLRSDSARVRAAMVVCSAVLA